MNILKVWFQINFRVGASNILRDLGDDNIWCNGLLYCFDVLFLGTLWHYWIPVHFFFVIAVIIQKLSSGKNVLRTPGFSAHSVVERRTTTHTEHHTDNKDIEMRYFPFPWIAKTYHYIKRFFQQNQYSSRTLHMQKSKPLAHCQIID